MSTTRIHRLLMGAAVLLGFGALAAGEPSPGGRVDVARLAVVVERELDHVTALELAAWIRDRKPGLRVVDVRGADDFAEFHVPTAEHLSLPELIRTPFGPDETVVIYSEGGTHAAQGWFFLQTLGVKRVYFLRGGLYEWLTEVMEPVLPPDATPAQKAAFEETAALSRYFGGAPRVGVPGAEPDGDAAAIPSRAGNHDHDHDERGDAGEDGGRTEAAVARVRRLGC